jgi:hypothetical protein
MAARPESCCHCSSCSERGDVCRRWSGFWFLRWSSATGGVSAAGAGGSRAEAGQAQRAAGAVTGGAPAAPLGPECSLPPERGSCNGGDDWWYYDAAAGGCQKFYYSACEGNANRYQTLAERIVACGTSAQCTSSADCRLTPLSKDFDWCEPMQADDFIGMTREDAGKDPPSDTPVEPAPCPALEPGSIPTVGNFFSACVDSECAVIDVRESDAAMCATDDDCFLRSGPQCCEHCSSRPIAISDASVLTRMLECDPDGACQDCAADLSAYRAVCDAGTCRVSAD